MSRCNQPFLSVAQAGARVHVTWMMGSGETNAPQVALSMVGGGYNTNTVGSVTNYLDVGGAINVPLRSYRVRIAP